MDYAAPRLILGFIHKLLKLIGSFAPQVNALVPKYTVDSINELIVAIECIKMNYKPNTNCGHKGLDLEKHFFRTRKGYVGVFA